jgi:hypothetical protein
VTEADYSEWRQSWPEFVVGTRGDAAVDLLQRYYAVGDGGNPRYTGAWFERLAALNDDPNTIAPADFAAVSMLSVKVPPRAAIRLLGPDSASISELLSQIDDSIDIVDVQPEVLCADSPAGELWSVLRSGRDGLGPTTTSKLLAAKRPRLVPIWDTFVERATGLDTVDYWAKFRSVLNADDRRIWKWLGNIRSQVSNVPKSVTELRILDVLLWMSVATGLKVGNPTPSQ